MIVIALFDFLKKKADKSSTVLEQLNKANDLASMGKILAENGVVSVPKDDNHNTLGEFLGRLTPDGELPFGWVAHNHEFTSKIESEFTYFMNNWINSRGKDVQQERIALKSFIQYMKDVQKLCDSKGECFSFWCSEILIGKGYIDKRQDDLKHLEASVSPE